MRPSYVLPAAMGRMARIGYSPKHEEPLTPLGGDFHYFPDRTGIANWTVNYTVTTGNIFVRLLYLHDSGESSAIRVYFNGVEIPRLTIWFASSNTKLGAAIFGGSGFPNVAGTITIINVGGESGVAIMRVGGLRDYTSLGALSSYGSRGSATGLQIAIPTTPGNDVALLGGVSGPAGASIRPVTVSPYYPTAPNPPVVYPSSVGITEVTSTDGLTRVVGWFGACTSQETPYPSNYVGTMMLLKWNQSNNAFYYATSAAEVIGSVP